jgi:hypothetical protein
LSWWQRHCIAHLTTVHIFGRLHVGIESALLVGR